MADPVGLVGIGLMGTALAQRLLGTGFAIVGFDPDSARRNELERLGGTPAASVPDIARRCRQVLIAVMTMDQEVTRDLIGAATSVALCTSTGEPDRIAALAERAAAQGLAFLDTPVSGTSGQVLAGDGYGLIAGDPAAAKAADSILSAIYPRRRFVGPAGAATKTKLAINHILGLNRVALAEGLVFAERLGLDLADFLDAARRSAAYSQIMDVKGDKMIARDFTAVGKVSQHLSNSHACSHPGERLSKIPLGGGDDLRQVTI
ncbi:MAG TPA: NAD(P)-binding domain-containing protein [Pseudolabrys sp.]|nr:NAD(P)-binding domain-containing protein [Pseudolabrys sp.]